MSPWLGGTRARLATNPSIHEWWVPLLVAIAVLGPTLRPGVLFNLDLVLVPHLDTPTGFWGLGPELPRRLPLWVPISWASSALPATVSGKLLMVGLFVVSWSGMARLVRRMVPDAAALTTHAAAALYTISPFVLTRMAVGHFMVTWPHAVLPWVLAILVRPGRRLDSTFLACLLLGFAGHFGGSVAVTVVVVSVLCGRSERGVRAVVVAVAAQAPWLVPGLAVAAANEIRMAGGSSFPTAASGLAGLFRLSAGGGFWNTYFQVGGSGRVAALAGVLLLLFAVIGTPMLTTDFRRPLVALGVIGWLVAAGSALPVVGAGLVWLDGNLFGGIWREPHRVLTLHLLWLAPAAALGGRRLYDMALQRERWIAAAGPLAILPLALAVALGIPGLWGLGGQLQAEQLPQSWGNARQDIRDAPGTVLALPWYQYFNLSISDGPVRRVLNPLPLYLGGDVLSSSDNGLLAGVREFGDPRERSATDLIGQLRSGESISNGLADLGVRWVVVLDTPIPDDYRSLQDDRGLRLVVDSDGLELYEVLDWVGPAVATDGSPVAVNERGPAWANVESSEEVIWSRAGSAGWRRGFSTVAITDDGRLRVPSGEGHVWNVSTAPALAAQITPGVIVVVLVIRRTRRRSP